MGAEDAAGDVTGDATGDVAGDAAGARVTDAASGHPLAGTDGGIGLGYRPEVAMLVATRTDLVFTEVIAESIGRDPASVPHHLAEFVASGRPCIPHGVKLGLAGAARPEPERVARLRTAAEVLGAPLVSEHLAFVRAGGQEIGHLTPACRSREVLAIVCENVHIVQDQLPVPLAVEHAAALFAWPGDALTEAELVTEVLERTGAWLVLDLANVIVNAANHGGSPERFLDAIPMERVAYVHVAGGIERDGLLHDTHAHPLWPGVIGLVEDVARRAPCAPILLERDDRFPAVAELEAELDAIAAAIVRGRSGSRVVPTRMAGSNDPRSRNRAAAEGDRARIGAEQAALAAALVAGGPVPTGFDPARIAAAADALRHKRAGEVASRFPALAHALADDFAPRFVDYARRAPPPDGGTVADGLAFVAAAVDRATLTPQARDEIAALRPARRPRFRPQGRSRARRSS